MSISSFHIDQKETVEANLFYVSGDLDLSVAPQMRTSLESVVNRSDKPLILDLKNLKYIDSTGIGIIISVLKIRDELNAPFYVREIPPTIKRLFDLTGISGFLQEERDAKA